MNLQGESAESGCFEAQRSTCVGREGKERERKERKSGKNEQTMLESQRESQVESHLSMASHSEHTQSKRTPNKWIQDDLRRKKGIQKEISQKETLHRDIRQPRVNVHTEGFSECLSPTPGELHTPECVPSESTPSPSLLSFNSTLSRFSSSNIYVITSPHQLRTLLDLHYSASNTLPPAAEMFPYLHGLANIRLRVYFHPDFRAETDLHVLAEDVPSLQRKYPHSATVDVPTSGFHLMTVHTVQCDRPKLANSVCVDRILAAGRKPHFGQNFEAEPPQQFDSVFQLDENITTGLANRSYALQVRLAAPLAHFLVYNNHMDFYANTTAARAICDRMGNRPRCVYVVDFGVENWGAVGRYLDVDAGNPYSRLLLVEQDLIWQLNGTREVFRGFFTGNVSGLRLELEGTSPSAHGFGLCIFCHEHGRVPSQQQLRRVFQKKEREREKNRESTLFEPLCIEFPDCVARYGPPLNLELVSILNVVRLVDAVVNCTGKPVLAYLFDGFTGTALLLLLLGMWWSSDGLETVACSVLSTHKHYVMPGDIEVAREMEPYIAALRGRKKSFSLVNNFPLSQPPRLHSLDWFHPASDANFPCAMHDNVYLGLADHALSTTVMRALEISRCVSIDEKPAWFKHLKCTFEHEATPQTAGPTVRPIYTFNNGTAQVYEIKVNEAVRAKLFDADAPVPHLKSIVYIHNVRDDGKDSMLPLLVDCPESVQRKFLVDPAENVKTLVHCRIGVSRLATLVIASVMKHLHLDLVDAYMYVRVRRFNVIIQPNLRIFYELFLYDDMLQRARHGASYKRKHCWWLVCDQIHRLNQNYMR